jgi:hypothetical protein
MDPTDDARTLSDEDITTISGTAETERPPQDADGTDTPQTDDQDSSDSDDKDSSDSDDKDSSDSDDTDSTDTTS